MLRQQIIRLKNIIVFKIASAIMCGLFLLWQLPASMLELQDSNNNLKMAEGELEDIEAKVQFTKASQSVVDSTFHVYSEALKNPASVSCIATDSLNQKFTELGNQFRLQHPPIMSTSETPQLSKFNESRAISILSTDTILTFPAQGFSHALAFITEAYKVLPPYTLITGLHIKFNETITPSTLQILAINVEPQLINTDLHFQMREIKASTN